MRFLANIQITIVRLLDLVYPRTGPAPSACGQVLRAAWPLALLPLLVVPATAMLLATAAALPGSPPAPVLPISASHHERMRLKAGENVCQMHFM